MFRRNLLFAFAFVVPIFWFSQGAYAQFWDFDPSFWGMGSDQVKGSCQGLTGTVEVGGQTATVNVAGKCNLEIPAASDVACNYQVTYTLPAPPPLKKQPNGTFLQDWTAACNLPGLVVDGVFTCVDKGVKIFDPLGLEQKNKPVNSNDCIKLFGLANSPVFQANITFDTDNPQTRKVFDLSLATTVRGCHADQQSGVAGVVNCFDGKDIQKWSGTGTNVTRAFCSYSEPIQDNCSAPDSGIFTARLHAVPANATDPLAISISLDSVDEQSITVNGQPQDAQHPCKRGNFKGGDVIDCGFNSCDSNGDFVIPGGTAILTANRDITQSVIQCVNTVKLQ
jgi:hypothetical protein